MFQPDVGLELKIDGKALRVAPHPSAPKIPYGQEGKQAIVFKLSGDGGESLALKVFKPRYRRPFLVTVTERMAAYSSLPGMRVCEREVLTPHRHLDLLKAHPDLSYAAVMPWIEGPTWSEVLLSRRILAPQECLDMARTLLRVLVALEEKGLSHGDLSGVNVMIPRLVGGDGVDLVDVEQLYIPGMEKPDVLPEGSPGYGFPRISRETLWGPFTDRFPGSVILAEMLCFCDKEIVKASWGESYFSPEELGQNSLRYQLMEGILEKRYGERVAAIFRRSWFAREPEDCAPFAEWLIYLPEEAVEVVEKREAEEREAKVKTHQVIPKREWDLEGLLARAEELGARGDRRGAIELYEYVLAVFTLPEDFKAHISSEVKRFKSELERGKEETGKEKGPANEPDALVYPVIIKPSPVAETVIVKRPDDAEETARAEEEPEAPGEPAIPLGLEEQLQPKRLSRKKLVATISAAAALLLTTAVLLVVFLGRGPGESKEVEVPDLTGTALEEARASLEEAGLVLGEIGTQETADVQPGMVIALSPEPGSVVPRGSEVDIVLSAEPGKVGIPDLAGVEQGQAHAMLQGLGLVVDVGGEANDSVAQGHCIRTEPGAGASVDPGSTVRLIVSTGPQAQQQHTATCPTCGGSGQIACTACGGAGGNYTTTTSTCPTCGGNGWVRCSNCGGSGFLPGNVVCPACGGRGTVVCSTCGGSGQATSRVLVPCSRCGGSGKSTCPTCRGSGRVTVN